MKKAETEILQQAISGSRSAFGKLVELHQEKVLYLAYDLMGDWDDAKDAAQETFIRAFQKLGRGQVPEMTPVRTTVDRLVHATITTDVHVV